MSPAQEYVVGIRSEQVVMHAGKEKIPLVNILDRHNMIVGATHSQKLAERIVRLLNQDEDRIAAKLCLEREG